VALSSLKRKCSLMDEEEVSVDSAASASQSPNALRAVAADASPRKRLKTFAAVMHTATAVTVGAVATWGILAFT
jgi:hypothetical protein